MLPSFARLPRAHARTLLLVSLLFMTTGTALMAFVPAPAAARAVLHPHSSGIVTGVHTVRANNTTADSTILSDISEGARDIIHVTSTYNTIGCGCIYDSHPLGVRWNGTSWEIFHEDHTAFTVGTTYNWSFTMGGTGIPDFFSVVTTAANSGGGFTLLDNPNLNGNPNAVVNATPNWNPGGICGCVVNNHYIGVRYTGSRWAIFNQDGAPIPVGAGFNVLIASGTPTAPSTSSTYIDYISFPGGQNLDNQPNVIIIVTPNYNSFGTCGCVIDNHPIGVYYDYALNKWGIYHQDYAPMPTGVVYNVSTFFQSTPSYADLTGVWQGDDNAYYYIREIGNVITWAGFSSDNGATFTNVFSATRSADSLSGNWADVPRGNTLGSGTLALQLNETNFSTVTIHKTGGTGNSFGASNWHLVTAPAVPAAIPPYHLAYQIAHPAELTGVWSSTQPNDGSVYYVRQVGSQVYWLGISGDNGQFFTNVFVGQRSGDTFSGTWNDVPRGTTTGRGSLALAFSYPDFFWAYSSTGGFGTSQWSRYIPN